MIETEEIKDLRTKYQYIRSKLRMAEVRTRMQSEGHDPQKEFARFDQQFQAVLSADAAADEAIEKLVHDRHDADKAMYALQRVTKKLLAETQASDASNPEIEPLRELLKILAFHLQPKHFE